MKKTGKKDFVFKLTVGPDVEHVLAAPDEKSYHDWMSSLKKLIHKADKEQKEFKIVQQKQ